MGGRKVLSLLLCGIVLGGLCSGCWDRKEFNQLAIAQVVALDYRQAQYTMALQLVMPKAGQEEASKDQLWVIEGSGPTVSAALEQIVLRAPRELYLDHLELVLLGEELLQEDLGRALEYLTEQRVLRRRTRLMAVEGQAGALLQHQPKLAEVDLSYLSNLLQDQSRWVRRGNATINDYALCSRPVAQGLVIPKVEAADDRALQLNGAALVQEGRLVAWIDRDWLSAYHWFIGGQDIITLDEAALTASELRLRGRSVGLEVCKQPCQWELISTEPLVVRANLRGSLLLVEDGRQLSGQLRREEAYQRQVQQLAEAQITAQVTEHIAQAQAMGCDLLQLGQWLYAWHPDCMDREAWGSQFSDLEIQVQLETTVESVQLR